MDSEHTVTLFLNKYANKQKKLENFTNTLPEILKLKGTWSVAVTTLSYTKSWYTVQTDQQIDLLYYDIDAPDATRVSRVATAIIPANTYNNEELVIKVNDAINEHFENQRIFKATKERVTDLPIVTFNRRYGFMIRPGIIENCEFLFIKPSPALAYRLGYNSEEILADAGNEFLKYKALQDAQPDVPLPFLERPKAQWTQDFVKFFDQVSHFYVYSDICYPTIVGEVKRPLLKVVEVPRDSEFGDQITLHYDNPEYVPVLKNEIYKIGVRIKRELYPIKDLERYEDDLEFNFGKVLITLHFKKISPQEPKFKPVPNMEYYFPDELAPRFPSKDRDSVCVEAKTVDTTVKPDPPSS